MLHDTRVYTVIAHSWPVSSRFDVTLDTALENRNSSLALVPGDRHQPTCTGYLPVLLIILLPSLILTTAAWGQSQGYSPQDRVKVVLLSDNSMLSRQMLRSADENKGLRDLLIRIEKQLLTDSYERMQQTVLDYQNRLDCIVLLNTMTADLQQDD